MKDTQTQNQNRLSLDNLQNGECARIVSMDGLDTRTANRFLDLGLLRGEIVTFIQRAPLGDPIWLEVKGYQLAFRREMARKIYVERIPSCPKKGKEAQG